MFKKVPVIKLSRIPAGTTRVKNELKERSNNNREMQFESVPALEGVVKPEDIILSSNEININIEVNPPCPDSYFLRARETKKGSKIKELSIREMEPELQIISANDPVLYIEPQEEREVEKTENISIKKIMLEDIAKRTPVIKLTRISFVSELDPRVKREIKIEPIENSIPQDFVISKDFARYSRKPNLESFPKNRMEIRIYRRSMRVKKPFPKFAIPESDEENEKDDVESNLQNNASKKLDLNQTERVSSEEKYIKDFLQKSKRGRKPKAKNCNICDKTFKCVRNLKRHLLTHVKNREKSVYCQHCNCSYYTEEQLNVHILRMHTQTDHELLCTHCGRAFWNQIQFNSHVYYSHAKSFSCKICNKLFRRNANLIKHLKVHTRKDVLVKTKKAFKCRICGWEFDRIRYLQKHLLTHLKNRERPSICKHCNKGFYDEYQLMMHAKRHEKSESELLCNVCGMIYWNQVQFDRHIKMHDINIPCPICKRNFNSNFSLKSHMNYHTKKDKFECKICKKQYLSQRNLKAHSKTHTESKDFKCQEKDCGKAFKTNYALKSHMSTHKIDGVIYKCTYCTNEYSSKPGLRQHLYLKHKNEIQREYKCTVGGCKRSFSSLLRLEKHLKDHEKPDKPERSFMCSECGKCFKMAHHLNTHMESHKSERNYKCDVEGCNRDFKHQSNLFDHKKFYHNMTEEERRAYSKRLRELKKKKEHGGSGME